MARAPRTARARALPLALLVPFALSAAACDGGEDGGDRGDGADGGLAPIGPDAALVWSAAVETDWSVTDVVAAGDVLVAATSWSLEEESRVIGYDAAGVELWRGSAAYGTVELAVLDDRTVRACDDLGGEILDAADGSVVREASEEECPENADGADTTDGDLYDVEGAELVVYADPGLDEERFRIALEDDDAVAWGVEGAVATYSASSAQLRLYR